MRSPYTNIERLYFVWNAEWSFAGAVQAAQDFVRGVESCALCEIAYSGIRPKSDWQRCQAAIPVPLEIRFKNQLSDDLQAVAAADYPVVIACQKGQLVKVMGQREINACTGRVEVFKQVLEAALQAL